MAQFPAALNAKEDDIAKMLAVSAHVGSRNLDPSMERYIWKRRSDGIYLISMCEFYVFQIHSIFEF